MTENRTSSGGPQGQYSGGPQNEIERLANDPNISRHVWICQNPPGWDGGFYTRDTLNQFDYESAHYVSCALIRQGSTTRSNATFMAAWLFCLDDVCDVVLHVAGETPKAIRRKDVDELIAFGFLPAASTIKETSAGNYQYQWRLALEHDFARWNYFLIQCKGHKLIGPSLQQGDPVHYYRLGTGTNTKPGKNNFPTRMVKAYDGSVHKLDDIAAGLGIDMSPAAIVAWASAQAKSSPADETASDEALTEIMKLIPNDSFFDDRTRWAAIGFALKNASGDSPVIRDLWIDWDNVTNGADAARFWDTAHEPKAGLSTLRREIERRYGAQSSQREEVARILAREVFGTPEPGAAPMPEKAPESTADVFGAAWVRPKTKLPYRDWLYGTTYIRQFVSGLVAPGGTGKTSLSFVEALSMATGRELLGIKPRAAYRVAIWNGEDPKIELDRRLEAICLHYGISDAEIGDRLLVTSARDAKEQDRLLVAKVINGTITLQAPLMKRVVAQLKRDKIDVLIIDPFIASHQVPENSNDAIELVVKEWSRVAEQANCSVLLVHHLRKMDMASSEVTADDARGASAYRDALRVLRLVATMDKDTAKKAGLKNHRAYFRVVDGKQSMAPARSEDEWYRFVSVSLGNGEPFPLVGDPVPDDQVGVVTAWTAPAATTGLMDQDIGRVQRAISGGDYRLSSQAKDWVGNVVGRVLGLDASDPGGRGRIKGIVDDWVRDGWLKVVLKKDVKRMEREFVEVGKMWAPSDETAFENVEDDDVATP